MTYQRSGGKSAPEVADSKGQEPLTDITRSAGQINLEQEEESQKVDPSSGFWHELLSELMYLEATSAYWALQAANPADVELREFNQELQSHSAVLQAGQVAENEYLTCLTCGNHYSVTDAVEIEPCDCGGRRFSIGLHH